MQFIAMESLSHALRSRKKADHGERNGKIETTDAVIGSYCKFLARRYDDFTIDADTVPCSLSLHAFPLANNNEMFKFDTLNWMVIEMKAWNT